MAGMQRKNDIKLVIYIICGDKSSEMVLRYVKFFNMQMSCCITFKLTREMGDIKREIIEIDVVLSEG